MFFGKKTRNATEDSVPSSTAKSSAIRFSDRIAGVFNRVYRMILSVDLSNNVYQIESGEPVFEGSSIPQRGYYNNFYSIISGGVFEDENKTLIEAFSPASLSEAFLNGKTTVSVICKLGSISDIDEQTFNYYELRADKLPDENGRNRCILYIKDSSPACELNHSENENQSEDNHFSANSLKDMRIKKLLCPKGSAFLEYNIAEDKMTVHASEGNGERIVNNYLSNINRRCDWTVFHDDIPILSESLKVAIGGNNIHMEIRYRSDGVRTNDFKLHRLTLAPDNETNPHLILGYIAPLDADNAKDKSAATLRIRAIIDNIFISIVEIDLSRNVQYKLSHEGDDFRRVGTPKHYDERVRRNIANGYICSESIDIFNKTLEKGYLKRKCIKGHYAAEVHLILPGNSEARWYSDTYVPLPGEDRYLRLRRDIDEQHKIGVNIYAAAEKERVYKFYRLMLNTIADLVEFRNIESGAHIANVGLLTKILLEDIANRSPLYGLNKHIIDLYTEASAMHDIGKIVIPDHILNSTNKLSADEQEIMRTHTTLGEKILRRVSIPGQEELINTCRQVALHHHERYDGNGYPAGLVGDKIPIGVQAVGLADCYDALVSERCYKKAIPHEKAVEMIVSGKCGAFNPRLLETLQFCKEKLKEIYINPSEEEAEETAK